MKGIARKLGLKQFSSKINFSTSLRLNGKKFKIPVIRNMGLLNLKVREDWFLDLLKKLNIPEKSAFVDIGVNVGQTLLTFRSHYNNPYWGFEPNPSCVFYLHNLIEANSFKHTHILPVGLSTGSELMKFYIKNEVDSAGTIVKDLRPDYYENEQVNYVPLFAFDSLAMDEIKPISLIKIDVEGAELEVMSGLVKTLALHRPKIICEILDCHSEKSQAAMQARADKLMKLLADHQYEVYRILHAGGSISFEKIKSLTLKLWTPESFDLNDYLFVPAGQNPL